MMPYYVVVDASWIQSAADPSNEGQSSGWIQASKVVLVSSEIHDPQCQYPDPKPPCFWQKVNHARRTGIRVTYNKI